MIRLLLALAIGAGAAAVLHTTLTGSDRLSWVWIATIVIVSVAIPLVVIFRVGRSSMRATPDEIEAARRAGRTGVARIDTARRTGLLVNDVPQYELEISVVPADRAPYRTVERQLIDPMAMTDFAPGSVRDIVRVHADDPRIALVPATARSVKARPVIPPADRIEPWIVRGRRPGDPLLGVDREGRARRWIAYLILAAVGAAAVVVPVHEEFALRVESLVTREDRASMFADGRAEQAVTAIQDEAGTADAFEVVVFSGHLTADLATSTGADTVDEWTWRGGFVDHNGPAPIQPADPTAERFSLDDVDWAVLADVVDDALRESGLSRDELVRDPYAYVDRSGLDGTLVIRVYLATAYDSVTVTFDPDGAPVAG